MIEFLFEKIIIPLEKIICWENIQEKILNLEATPKDVFCEAVILMTIIILPFIFLVLLIKWLFL